MERKSIATLNGKSTVDDLVKVYEPSRLRLVMICNARGGISSKLTIDSDWKIRGGEDKFRDWSASREEW